MSPCLVSVRHCCCCFSRGVWGQVDRTQIFIPELIEDYDLDSQEFEDVKTALKAAFQVNACCLSPSLSRPLVLPPRACALSAADGARAAKSEARGDARGGAGAWAGSSRCLRQSGADQVSRRRRRKPGLLPPLPARFPAVRLPCRFYPQNSCVLPNLKVGFVNRYYGEASEVL